MVPAQPKEKKASKRIKWSTLSGAAQDILIKFLLGKHHEFIQHIRPAFTLL